MKVGVCREDFGFRASTTTAKAMLYDSSDNNEVKQKHIKYIR